MRETLVFLLLFSAVLAGCIDGNPVASPTSGPAVQATVPPVATATSTATPVLTATETPTATPVVQEVAGTPTPVPESIRVEALQSNWSEKTTRILDLVNRSDCDAILAGIGEADELAVSLAVDIRTSDVASSITLDMTERLATINGILQRMRQRCDSRLALKNPEVIKLVPCVTKAENDAKWGACALSDAPPCDKAPTRYDLCSGDENRMDILGTNLNQLEFANGWAWSNFKDLERYCAISPNMDVYCPRMNCYAGNKPGQNVNLLYCSSLSRAIEHQVVAADGKIEKQESCSPVLVLDKSNGSYMSLDC